MVVEPPWANGAGKRTILKAIPSVLHPDEGSIFFEQNTGNRGPKELVCPAEPQKTLPNLGKSLKARPLHPYPENPPNPP